MICPICGREFFRPPALSRRDPSILICSRDGTREALEDLGMDEEQIEGILTAIYGDDVVEHKQVHQITSPSSTVLPGIISLMADGRLS